MLMHIYYNNLLFPRGLSLFTLLVPRCGETSWGTNVRLVYLIPDS